MECFLPEAWSNAPDVVVTDCYASIGRTPDGFGPWRCKLDRLDGYPCGVGDFSWVSAGGWRVNAVSSGAGFEWPRFSFVTWPLCAEPLAC